MGGERVDHPAIVRLCHWLTALAVALLIASGLEIFAAFPGFGDKIPQRDLFMPPGAIRLGGWLGGALQWHLALAWIFAGVGLGYVAYQAMTGNYRQVLFTPRDVPGLGPMIRHYVLRAPTPSGHGTYNPLQKLAYTTVLVLGVILIVTGLALYKPVQLSGLVAVLGGFRLTRVWHFTAMCGVVAFIPGHLLMVALHGWGNFSSMWTGGSASSG